MVVLVAHNAFGFDKIMLEKECAGNGLRLPAHWRFYDSLLTYRREFPDLVSKKLGDIYQNRFNEPIQNAHDALSDTLALQRLFRHDLQHVFDLADTQPATIIGYTPNEAPVLELRGIGPYTKKNVVKMLGMTEPTVGDLRQFCAGMSVNKVELLVRTKLKCVKETFLFSILCEIMVHPNPVALFNEQFPTVIGKFPGLSEKSIQQLLAMHVRSPEQLKRHYLYVLDESADQWDALLKKLDCDPFRVSLLMRGL